MEEVVWLHETRQFAFLVSMHAHYAVVKLTPNGRHFVVENGNYDLWEERAIDFESDDDTGG
jgi:hypothetical protein